MKIAISTLVTPAKVAGVGHYLQRLIEGLQAVDQSNEYLILVSKENRHLFSVHAPNFRQVVLPFRHDPRWIMRPLYFLWQNFLFGWFSKKHAIDVLHLPNLVPVVKSSVPTVVTLHDFAEHYITRYNSVFRQWYRRWIPNIVVRNAVQIITISEHSKKDMQELFHADENKINVIYEAAGIPPKNIESRIPSDNETLKGIDLPFFFYVGSALPHKNLSIVIEALAELCQRTRKVWPLVFAGGFGEYEERLKCRASQLGVLDKIHFLGYVSENYLAQLYRHSGCFLFPSKYEGFGLPLLESMQFGLPVIASDRSCLPEIAGDAALYADAESAGEWASCMQSIMSDEHLRVKLIEAGKLRCSGFSWTRCALETIQVYRKAGGVNARR